MIISIRDVAREAGVSVSAASKALNDYPDISEETKNKVKSTAKQIGYVPNRSAKNLSSKSQKNVAILLFGLLEEKQSDEYVMSVMKGAARYLLEHQMNAPVYAVDSALQKKKSLSEFCHEFSLSGVLLFGFKVYDRYVKEAGYSSIPCVGVDYNIQGDCAASVQIDDCKAFEEITSHVIEQNHKNIVLVYGRVAAEVSEERYQGFCNALHRYGLEEQDVTILYTDFQESESRQKVRSYLKKYGASKATAFICMSDMIAMGVYKAVKECGYSIPKDFSVTGFDGFAFLDFVEPRLTTVDQDACGKGYEAGRLLERLVNGERNLNTVFHPYEIVYGNSVRKI